MKEKLYPKHNLKIIFAFMFNNIPHLKALLQRLAIIYIFYALCRLIFLLFNTTLYQLGFAKIISTFYYGLLFDTSAIIYTNAIFILLHLIPIKLRWKEWYQAMLKVYFLTVNGIALLLNLIDTSYYSFSGKRSGIELMAMKGEIKGLVIFNYLLDFWYAFLLFFALLFLLNKCYNYTKLKLTAKEWSWYYQVLFIPVVAALSFIGARGGFALIPLNTFDAARLVGVNAANLATNTPFHVIMSVQQVGLEKQNYFAQDIADHYYKLIKQNNNVTDTSKPNVVLIIVESLGKEYVGFYNNGVGFTPFIDSLASHATVYTHCYANCKRSIEGVACIMASMPSWMETDYISSYYQTNQLKSIGAYLSNEGYKTSFYHGGINGTMSFDNFIANTNGGEYYGKNEYPNQNDYDGNWGIYDDKYLSYWADELNEKSKPFFSACFTLSSHHPYNIPEELQAKFPKEKQEMHRSVRYVDYSLQQFFAKVKYMPWYKNTVFIITADHSSLNSLAKYNTDVGKYEIPLLVYDARKPGFVKNDTTTQQLSVLPLVLKLTNYRKPYFSFDGNDANRFALSYQNGYYQIIKDSFAYHFTGKSGLGFYEIKTDSLMTNNLINKPVFAQQKSYLDTLVKIVIQQYNNALINNRMTDNK